jgi:hypothetical protein
MDASFSSAASASVSAMVAAGIRTEA